MTNTPTVVAVCGSLRTGSRTRTTLQHVLAAAEAAGADTELLDLAEWDLPLYDPNHDEQGDSAAIKRRIREADALVLGTPVYHGSYSSTLKNVLDFCGSDEFADTTVGLVATAGGAAFGPTLEHLRAICRNLHAWVIPHQLGVPSAYDAFDDEGSFVDESLADRAETLGRELVAYATITPSPPAESPTCADD